MTDMRLFDVRVTVEWIEGDGLAATLHPLRGPQASRSEA
jgi:hypothetical protein